MSAFDPRLKITWFVLYSILIFTHNNLPSQIFLMAFIFLMVYCSGRKLLPIFKKIRVLLFFLPLTFAIHLFFSTSFFYDIFSSGVVGWDIRQLGLPFIYTLRIANFMVFVAWVLDWIDADRALDGIYALLKPLKRIKFPVDELFQVIFIAVRFFPILQEEYRRIDTSWKSFSRGDKQENQLVKILNLLVSLLIFSFRKADKLALAMHVRGYGKAPRTYYSKLNPGMIDLAGLVFFISFFLIVNKIGKVY